MQSFILFGKASFNLLITNVFYGVGGSNLALF